MDKIDVIEIFINGEKIGKMALTEQNLCAFEYDTEFLKNGFSISPYFLPLRSELFVAKREPFFGNFGVFDDSLPDGWGALVLDRFLKTKNINPEKLTVLQHLALVGTNGRGALEYFPDKSIKRENDFLDLHQLSSETEKMLTSEYSGENLETLYYYGGSSGGVRPKIFTKIDGKEWLIKFKAISDPADVGEIEFEYSVLARQCGIEMPETRLFEKKYFGVERFDRTSAGKIHTISAAGLLNADYRIPSIDYTDLLKICFNLTKNAENVYALFRHMVFNIVIKNRDDHAKNFSFQHKNNTWKLSPAYDILPSLGFRGFHTTTVNGQGKPTMKDILQVATNAALNKKRTAEIIEQVAETCRKKISIII